MNATRPASIREVLDADVNPRDVLNAKPLECALEHVYENAGYEGCRERNALIHRQMVEELLDGHRPIIKGEHPTDPETGWQNVQSCVTAMAWCAEVNEEPGLVPILLGFLTDAERDKWQRQYDYSVACAGLPDEMIATIPEPPDLFAVSHGGDGDAGS